MKQLLKCAIKHLKIELNTKLSLKEHEKKINSEIIVYNKWICILIN